MNKYRYVLYLYGGKDDGQELAYFENEADAINHARNIEAIGIVTTIWDTETNTMIINYD